MIVAQTFLSAVSRAFQPALPFAGRTACRQECRRYGRQECLRYELWRAAVARWDFGEGLKSLAAPAATVRVAGE